MAIMKMLGIGVPSFNRGAQLLKLVESIEANTNAPYRLWIVDDFSDQKTQRVLAFLEKQGQATIIRKQHRPLAGFDTFNHVLDIAQQYQDECPYFVKLDDDLEIITKGWDDLIIKILDEEPKTMVTCQSCNVRFPPVEGYIRQCKAEFLAFRSSMLNIVGRFIERDADGNPMAYSMDSEFTERLGIYGYRIKQIPDVYKTVADGTNRRSKHFASEQPALDAAKKTSIDLWKGIEKSHRAFMLPGKVEKDLP